MYKTKAVAIVLAVTGLVDFRNLAGSRENFRPRLNDLPSNGLELSGSHIPGTKRGVTHGFPRAPS